MSVCHRYLVQTTLETVAFPKPSPLITLVNDLEQPHRILVNSSSKL